MQICETLLGLALSGPYTLWACHDQQEERRTENWVVPGIVVKVLNKKLAGGKFYKKKGRVERVIDKFIGEK